LVEQPEERHEPFQPDEAEKAPRHIVGEKQANYSSAAKLDHMNNEVVPLLWPLQT
jgi:hypothetical protein